MIRLLWRRNPRRCVPKDLEHGSHGYSDCSAVKRIVASLRYEHCVDSKCGRAAENGSDIGVVRDVFEHGYSSGIAAYFFYACSMGRRKAPSAPRVSSKPVSCLS